MRPIGQLRNTSDAAVVYAACAVLAPMAGLAVEIALAWRFGATSLMDAFRADYLIVGFGSSLLFSQILPHILIPAFYSRRASHSEEEAWRLTFCLGAVLGLLALALSLVVCLDPAPLVGFLAPGLRGAGRANAFALARYFALSLALMTWSGTMNGVLHVYRVFIILPLCQILTNVLLVASVVTLGASSGVASIGGAILAGSFLTVLVHLLLLRKLRQRLGLRGRVLAKFSSFQELRFGMHTAWPLLFLFVSQQFAVLVFNRAWSTLPAGTLATVGYAWKLLLITGLVPTSLAIVVFPSLSEASAEGDASLERKRLNQVLRMSLFLSVPLLPILYVLRGEIVRWLFTRGAMAIAEAQSIGDIFGVLLIGAPAAVISGVLIKFYCAKQDVWTPLFVSLLTVALSAILASWAAQRHGLWGVVTVSNCANWANAMGLLSAQMLGHKVVRLREFALYFVKLTAVAGCIATLAAANSINGFETGFGRVFFDLCIVIAGLGLWYVVSRALGVGEARDIVSYSRIRLFGLVSRLGLGV